MLAAQLNELGVSQGPEAPPRPNRQHKGPAVSSTSNSVQPAGGNDQNNKQMPQSSSILDQVSYRSSLPHPWLLIIRLSAAKESDFVTPFPALVSVHLYLSISFVVLYLLLFLFSYSLFVLLLSRKRYRNRRLASNSR